MNKLETNIVRSFREVKKDVLEMKNQLLRLAENQSELKTLILEKSSKPLPKTKIVEKVKIVKSKPSKKSYVAAKEGAKFHIPECPYAKNILPKGKLTFKSKDAALNKGYKPCSCVK